MMQNSEIKYLISEITRELDARCDGAGKNLISRCPYCKKEGKFGIYIGKETDKKKLFMANCFSCGMSTRTLEQLLTAIGREDLILTPVANIGSGISESLFKLEDEEGIDDTLGVVRLPDFYKRQFFHPYLKSRGFIFDDYEYFPVGTTGKLNRRFLDYVIFPVMDNGDTVGYVSRYTWSKKEIDQYNRKAKYKGDFQILRFRNSRENDFVKLLYNYDAIVEGETEVVILVEGIFDVIALTRKLELYDNTRVGVVATFGKKISQTQIYKIQSKGVSTVVIGYDGDAVEAIKRTSQELSRYFHVFIADIFDPSKDWEDLSEEEIYRTFTYRIKTPVEYSITKIQQ